MFTLNDISRAVLGSSREGVGNLTNMQVDVAVIGGSGRVIALIHAVDNASGDALLRSDSILARGYCMLLTMRRYLTLLPLLAVALAGFAEPIFEVDITTSASIAPTGATIPFTAIIRNVGTSAAPGMNVTLTSGPGPGLITNVPGCRLDRFGARCFVIGPLPGEALVFPFTAPVTNEQSAVGQRFHASISLLADIGDDMPVQGGDGAELPITMSPSLVDLGLRFIHPATGPQPIGPVTQTIEVTNHGPSNASPVTVDLISTADPLRLIGADGPWSCAGGDAAGIGTRFVCTLPSLAAGATSNLVVRLETTVARDYSFIAIPWAANATDPVAANDVALGGVSTGVAADFAPILLPLLVYETPGARARWTSELWVWGAGDGASLLLCRPGCPPDRTSTVQLTSQSVVKLWPHNFGDAPHGAMLYTERASAPRLSFSSRLFNSVSPPSRGVEIPVVREHDFRTERVVIPAVVLDPSHRFLIRIYDPDARPNAAVRVRLFLGGPQIRVIAERTLTLSTRPQQILLPGLPAYPGYAQTSDIFDGVIPEESSREVGVEVVSLVSGMRLWAFVSATENEGEHVTVWTPQ